MIGPQGSGKSVCSNYLEKTYKFKIISGDKQKTKSKMNKFYL